MISGILPLRNGVKLGYPFELAINSLKPFCDEVVVLVDPTSEDDTMARVRPLTTDGKTRIVESVWDMNNHQGLGGSEIAKQTRIAISHTKYPWILSLQADEVLHAKDAAWVRYSVAEAEGQGVNAFRMLRLYFFGSLGVLRLNWTVPLTRLFHKEKWEPDFWSGAMQFVHKGEGPHKTRSLSTSPMYHYSRVGDQESIAQRVRNLDTFYHDPAVVAAPDQVRPYSFDLRVLDTYKLDAEICRDEDAFLVPFPLDQHPAGVREYFRE